ncbi:class I SAM-dependent methyltransferase [Neorhizobium sp. P12A]|jgi:SAM-dependent methyltransferase|uniref:class I SAM-dependent methyltransferase n=1 Tax=Rhizobium/Agrobacterium group TaxID=227290 RepID=UPI001049401A|nr:MULTISPECIES: class I SAM-dependent methyltransferase [Rhizobium/Agrobacterium group]KAA0698298.1 class I SAM-dependent methyltransferase [Neorhizobium sp. P12A]TCR92937.1 methyltransferase family protein [Rhizobium sp. BK376]
MGSIFGGGPSTILKYVRQKSLRLIYANVKERILFDAVNGIDTITQVQKGAFSSRINNLAHGVHYSSSWTSEIVFGFEICRNKLGPDFEKYAFIDIGCGRGKVAIKWKQMLRKRRLEQNVYGMDYYDYLIEQAKYNYRKVIGKDGAFFCADATEFDYSILGGHVIVYLYHPFDETILRPVLAKLQNQSVIAIYNNPVHEDVLLSAGYKLVAEKRGFHPQAQTVVLERNPKNPQ